MKNQLTGSAYMAQVQASKTYAQPRFDGGTNRALIQDLMQSYLDCRGDRSFTPAKADAQGRFEALLAVVADRLDDYEEANR
jgi:hypothetical protein